MPCPQATPRAYQSALALIGMRPQPLSHTIRRSAALRVLTQKASANHKPPPAPRGSGGRVVMHRTANPRMPVRFRPGPPIISKSRGTRRYLMLRQQVRRGVACWQVQQHNSVCRSGAACNSNRMRTGHGYVKRLKHAVRGAHEVQVQLVQAILLQNPSLRWPAARVAVDPCRSPSLRGLIGPPSRPKGSER